MTRCLVAYYSWSGQTAGVAHAIAEAMGADLEVIREAQPRGGPFAFLRSILEAVQRRTPPILPSAHDVGSYDLVVIGGPVWAGRMASPPRTFAERERDRLPRIACFCTLGGANGASALADMQAACARKAEAELMITAADLKSGAWRGLVDAFVRQIGGKPASAEDVHTVSGR